MTTTLSRPLSSFFPAPEILKSQICYFSGSLLIRRVQTDLVLAHTMYMEVGCEDLRQTFCFPDEGTQTQLWCSPFMPSSYPSLPLLPIWKVEAMPGWIAATLA